MQRDTNRLFLDLLSKAIHNDIYEYNGSENEFLNLRGMAMKHKVLPLIFDSIQVYSDCNLNVLNEYDSLAHKAHSQIFVQSQRTADFLILLEYLACKGLYPVVMKGLICRNLYVNPEHRESVDEDLLIQPSDFSRYHTALLEYGFELVNPDTSIESAYEVSYRHTSLQLYIEVHTLMFDPKSHCGHLNNCFHTLLEKSIEEEIYGLLVHTLDYTDHLLFLILHAFKHFLYSGFGIRLVLDIVLFSKAYEEKIDWKEVYSALSDVNALYFACAIYLVGFHYLIPEWNVFEVLKDWPLSEVDENNLLEDILEGGVFGTSNISRNHSSIFTLQALSKGSSKTEWYNILSTVFRPLNYMKNSYSYLNKYPILLPVAWVQRVCNYVVKNKDSKKDLKKPIEIGNNRVLLLKEYKIIS